AANTTKNTAVVIDVLANDRDTDGDPMTITAVTTPGHGAAAILSDKTIRYTPSTGYTGTDTFLYTVGDGRGGSSTARVTVTVTVAPNRAPTATEDGATTSQNAAATVAVLANDSDPDGDALTVSSVSAPVHGTATKNGNGTVTYAPAAGFLG